MNRYGEIRMKRWLEYEQRYIKLHSRMFLGVGIAIPLSHYIGNDFPFPFYIGIALLFVLHNVKMHWIDQINMFNENKYKFLRMAELFIVTYFISYESGLYLIGSVVYLLFVLEIILADEEIRYIWYYKIYLYPFIIASSVAIIRKISFIFLKNTIIHILFFGTIIFIFAYILSWYAQEMKVQLEKNIYLWQQTKEKNKKLVDTQNNMEQVNIEIEKQKEELQEMNNRYRKTIAEFYILKEIGNYIGSVLEIEQLLSMITDIIMGVMGVDTCSIVLWDEEKDDMMFHVNSIYPQHIIEQFKTPAKDEHLIKLLYDASYYVENHVFSKQHQYSFLEGRNVGSFIVIPLCKNNQTYGFILVEHKMETYFSESSVEFFKAVSAQIVIAIENARLYKKMEQIASKDGLTQIYNRTYLKRIIPQLMKQAIEQHQSLAVAIFDLDSFKKVNDTYGHLFGDKVLRVVANLGQIKMEMHGGIIGRYGGEEFLLLLPGSTAIEMAEIMEELRHEINEYPIREGTILMNVQASFGVSAYPEIASNSTDLLKTADNAMYTSKKLGKNQVTIASMDIR